MKKIEDLVMCHMLFTLNHRGFKNLIITNLFPRTGSFTLKLLGFLVVDGSDQYIYRDGFFPAQLQCKHEVEVWILNSFPTFFP